MSRFRVGSKNGHTVYLSAPGQPDRFVCTAMSPEAAGVIASALYAYGAGEREDLIQSLPIVKPRS